MIFDWTINAGHVITLMLAVLSIFGVYVGMKLDIAIVKKSTDDIDKKVDGLQDDIKILNRLVSENAVLAQRMSRIEEDVRELRHGDGYIRKPPV